MYMMYIFVCGLLVTTILACVCVCRAGFDPYGFFPLDFSHQTYSAEDIIVMLSCLVSCPPHNQSDSPRAFEVQK